MHSLVLSSINLNKLPNIYLPIKLSTIMSILIHSVVSQAIWKEWPNYFSYGHTIMMDTRKLLYHSLPQPSNPHILSVPLQMSVNHQLANHMACNVQQETGMLHKFVLSKALWYTTMPMFT